MRNRNRARRVNVKCDGENGCFRKFTLSRYENRSIGGSLEEVYFECPYCHKHFTVYYTDPEIRSLQSKLRSTSDPAEQAEVRRVIKEKLIKLKKEVGS